MLFNSYIFILFFLPVSLLLYYGLNRLGRYTEAKIALVGMSFWFYAYFHLSYLLILAGSILFHFGCSRGFLKCKRKGTKKLLLALGLLFDLGLIFYFKYLGFFVGNINGLFHLSLPVRDILMPLGISFFTFQQISYLVDSYRGETAGYRFLDYALFVSFFPQLIAGPIVLHQEMIPQFADPARKRPDQYLLARGIRLFAIGLFKKVMIADVLGKGVTWGYADSSAMTGPDIAVVSLLYTLQIYFDFSGYCDMACGIANMFHLELPVNFLSPYQASSILEFWQRWHITLTRFLRKYIYIPLGGNRRGTFRTMVNVILVFLVSGIWHGAAWTFVLWGLLHGIASAACRLFKRIWDKLPRWIGVIATFLFVDLAWILFRAESLQQAGMIFRTLFSPWEFRISGELLGCFDLLEFTYLEDHIPLLANLAGKTSGGALQLVILLAVSLWIVFFQKNCHEKKFTPTLRNAFSSCLLLVWSIVSLSGLSTFLYFNF